MTLESLLTLLESNVHINKLFGDDPTKAYREYTKIAHPDKNIGNETQAARVFQLLQEKWKKFNNPVEPIIIKSGKNIYEIAEIFAKGDLSDLYLTKDEKFLLKVARRHTTAMKNEVDLLNKLRTSKNAAEPILEFFPIPHESFRIKNNRQVNVFGYKPNLFSFQQVLDKHSYLDERDFAWMFNRLLTVLGWCHQKNIIHGAILPTHCLIEPEKHGILLVDYTMSVEVGNSLKTISAAFEDFYPPEVFSKKPASPALDIYMAAKCGLFLLGNRKGKINNFLSTCLAKSPESRPQNSWRLQQEFSDLLARLFGPKKFRKFSMV